MSMPIDINAGQFLAFAALALATGAAVGFALGVKIYKHLMAGRQVEVF